MDTSSLRDRLLEAYNASRLPGSLDDEDDIPSLLLHGIKLPSADDPTAS